MPDIEFIKYLELTKDVIDNLDKNKLLVVWGRDKRILQQIVDRLDSTYFNIQVIHSNHADLNDFQKWYLKQIDSEKTGVQKDEYSSHY